MTFDTLSVDEKLIYLGGALAIVAAFLPWFTLDTVMGSSSVSGLDHNDGILTLLFGLTGIGITLFRERGTLESVAITCLGVATMFAGYHTLRQLSDYGGLGGEATASFGLYLTLVAGIVLAGGGYRSYRNATAPQCARTHQMAESESVKTTQADQTETLR